MAAMVVVSGGGFVPDNAHRRALLGYDDTTEGMRAVLRACFADEARAADDGYVARRVASGPVPGAWGATRRQRLTATGSQTVATDGELVVPDERFSTPQRLAARIDELTRHGVGPRRGGIARSLVTCTGVALGMADHALEVFTSGVRRRSVPYSPIRCSSSRRSPTTRSAAPTSGLGYR